MACEPVVTVAICSRNRASDLARTLEGIRSLRLPAGLPWELLVVDNGSRDGTDALLRRPWTLPLRPLHEPEPGISRARNRALAEAAAPLIVWTDDDVEVEAGWLEAYLGAAARHPDAAFFGGPIHPLYEAPPPTWLVRGFPAVRTAFAFVDAGPEERALRAGEVVFGASMAFRTPLLRQYRFDSGLGASGSQRLLGEETQVMRRMQGDGLRGVWVPDAKVGHRIPPQRLTLAYLAEYYVALGKSLVREGPLPPRPRAAALHSLWRAWVETWPRHLLQRAARRPPEAWLRTFRRMHFLRGRAKELLAR
ncbi:MAG: glycosyltransferase [Planctomycetaceae bacterium]